MSTQIIIDNQSMIDGSVSNDDDNNQILNASSLTDLNDQQPTIKMANSIDDLKQRCQTNNSESGIDDDCYDVNSDDFSDSSQSNSSMDDLKIPTLEEFYDKQSIFITGGTGFVGKVLIEKLLYEFETINRIYVMLRPKSGQLIRQRLDNLIECQVFDRIRRKFPERLKKLYPINGDIRYPHLGINPIDLKLLIRDVTIIFHSAATIRFDEPLKYALLMNTLGTKRVIQLGKKLNHLRSFVHISTAYCTVNKCKIEERVYFEPISPDRILEMADWMNDTTLNRLTETLYRGRPCSYHYTKSLAEHLLAEEVSNGCFYSAKKFSKNGKKSKSTTKWRPFPAAIVRPSIITPSWNEPFPGWIDNYNGFTGFLVVSGKGILRSMNVQKQYKCDLIPVDVVINTCILSAWYIDSIHYKSSKFPRQLTAADHYKNNNNNNDKCENEIFIVNCVTGIDNPITWNELRQISLPLMYRYPSMEMFRTPYIRFHRSKLLNQINVYVEHTIPAYVVDFVFKFMGFSPVLDQVYQKVHRVTDALEFFTTNEWTYVGNNMSLLLEKIDEVYRQREEISKIARLQNGHCTNSNNDNNPRNNRNQLLIKSTDVKQRFPIDIKKLNWQNYFHDYVLGVRQFLLKEDPSTIPKAQNQLFLIYLVSIMTKYLITGTICYQILFPKSIFRQSLRIFQNNNPQQSTNRLQFLMTILPFFKSSS